MVKSSSAAAGSADAPIEFSFLSFKYWWKEEQQKKKTEKKLEERIKGNRESPFNILTSCLSTLNRRLNKEFFFLLFARLIAIGTAAPRPQQIEPDFNSLHQRRRLLHRQPKAVLEFRARVFHGLQRSG